MQRKLLHAQLFVLVILGILDITLGIGFDFYRAIWWWDIPAHLLGGLWAGFFGAWLLVLRRGRPLLLYCIGAAIVLGIAWELFEVVSGLTHFPADTLDTVKDIFIDVVGGAAAGYRVAHIKRI